MTDEMHGVWATVEWTEADVIVALENEGLEPTKENIDEIIQRCSRHIEDYMIERGWEFINGAVFGLRLTQDREAKKNGK